MRFNDPGTRGHHPNLGDVQETHRLKHEQGGMQWLVVHLLRSAMRAKPHIALFDEGEAVPKEVLNLHLHQRGL